MELYTEIALINSIITTGEHGNPVSVFQLKDLRELLSDLEEEARAKANRLSGYRNVGRGFNAVIRSGSKTMDNRFHGATLLNGKLYVSDGHMLMRTPAKLELKMAEVPFDDAEKVFNMCQALVDGEEVFLPDYAELLNEVKTARRQIGKTPTLAYKFADGITINADYLLAAMMATNAMSFTKVKHSSSDMIAMIGNNVEAIILPIVGREKDTPKLGLNVLL